MVRKIFLIFSLFLSLLFGSEDSSQEVFDKRVRECVAVSTKRGEVPPECVPVLLILYLSTLQDDRGASAEKLKKEIGECTALLLEKRKTPPECWRVVEERWREFQKEAQMKRRLEEDLRRKTKEAKEIDYKLLESTIYRVGDKLISFVSVEVPLEEVEIVDWSGSKGTWLCTSGSKINLYRELREGDPSIEAVLYLSDRRLSLVKGIPQLPERLYRLVIKKTPKEERDFRVEVSKEGEITRISLPVEVLSLWGGLYLGRDSPITKRVCEAKLFTLKRPIDILKVEVMPGVKITIDVSGLFKKDLKLNSSEELR